MKRTIPDATIGKPSLMSRARHWLIKKIACGDLIILNAILTPEVDTGEFYLSLGNIDNGLIQYSSFGVSCCYIVKAEQNQP